MSRSFALLVAAGLLGLLSARGNGQELSVTKSVSIVLHLNAPPQAAFPMFDPVNETKWDPEWKPQLLGSRVEEGLVFLVGNGAHRSTWLLDRYDPLSYQIAYVVAAPSVLTRIVIGLKPENDGTIATVTYIKTPLDEAGKAAIEHFSRHFPDEGPHWESAINAALAREHYAARVSKRSKLRY